MGILYEARNITNDNVYVGITSGTLAERIRRHALDAKRGSERAFQRAIRKHGESSFEWREILQADEWRFLCAVEMLLIAEYRRIGKKIYNLTDGGDGAYGAVVSIETRLKRSKSLKGKRHTEETRARMSAVAALRRHSDETKTKLSKAQTGKKLDDATKLKMKASQTNRRKMESIFGKKENRPVGEAVHNSVLKEADVIQIVKMMDSGRTISEAMSRFNASFGAIQSIKCGKTWKSISAEPAKAREKTPPKAKKLSNTQVDEIRKMISGGMKQRSIAQEFGISEAHVSMIKSGQTRATNARSPD